MLRELVTICILLVTIDLTGQYFQQEIDYEINARYDKITHTVDGSLLIQYTNHSPRDLDTLYFNLWANAFSSKQNSYTDQNIKLGNLDYYFTDKYNQGGYQNINVKLNDKPHDLFYTVSNQIAYVVLNKNLPSGESIEISIDYSLTMPYLFDRLGWTSKGVQLVHWYPSIAVYNVDGWHPMEYLSMGELFGTIANYKVKLNLPYEKYVSSGPIDGQGFTPDIVDFAVIASDCATLSHEVVHGVELSLLHNDNPYIADCKKILEKALPWLEEHIGSYPLKTLGIVEKGKTSGMEYSGVVTIGAKDQKTTEIYLIHELIHQWFYGSLVTDQRKNAWLDEGFTTYYQQRLAEELNFGKIDDQLPNIYGLKDGVPLFQKLAMVQSYRQYDQPLCTHIQKLSTTNYLLNSYEVPARWIGLLENYLGKTVFDECMTTFYKLWKGKHPEPTDFLNIFEEVSGKSLTWMFHTMPNEDWSVDYKLEEENGVYTINNLSNLDAPYEVIASYKDGTKESFWNDGHLDKRNIDLESDRDLNSIEIGPKKGLVEKNIGNNRIGRKPKKLVLGTGLDLNTYSEIYTLPLLNYNTSDGITAGAAFYNSGILPKEWKFLFAPQYGFKSKNLIGQGWTSYDYYLDHPNFRKLFFKLGIKSYSDQYSNNLDSVNRYIKIDPTISLHFKHSPDSHKYSKLSFKYIHTINQEFGDISNTKSNICQLRYEVFNFYELGPSDLYSHLEFQPYRGIADQSEYYLKLVTSYKKSWLYSTDKRLSMRLYGSYHILNTRRNSTSYNRLLTRGASALIHQGFNDYTYEESWYNRTNMNQGFLGNQISNYGGGFKTPIGSSYALGQTNDLALALNFEIDIPVNLPKILPLGIYVDVGYYTAKDTGTNESRLVGNTLFSGGLALNYGEGLFSIYIPLYNNDPITNIYNSEEVNLLGKISFRFDINRFNPWEIVEDYNF